MLVDLDELELDLGALGDRRLGLQVGELALGEHGGVVGVDALLRDEEEALLRRLLDLGEARAAGAEQERGGPRADLDPERLRPRAGRERAQPALDLEGGRRLGDDDPVAGAGRALLASAPRAARR